MASSLFSFPEELSDYAVTRFEEEIEFWSKPHPSGFFAIPYTQTDGKLDAMTWSCGFPGMPGSAWEDGYYRVFIKFNIYYPRDPPECRFGKAPFHPNVADDGSFSVPFLTFGWNPEFRIETIILIIQEMIHNPDFHNSVQIEPYIAYCQDPEEFFEYAKEDAKLTAYNCVIPPF